MRSASIPEAKGEDGQAAREPFLLVARKSAGCRLDGSAIRSLGWAKRQLSRPADTSPFDPPGGITALMTPG